jgi:hypothetical protein
MLKGNLVRMKVPLFGLKSKNNALTRGTLYLQKLALTSPTNGGRSVGVVRLRTKATE